MKKNIFLSKNRRFITTKKRGRKSKRGKNSKWNKRGKRVKTVNTNMRKNRTKKGRRNIQKGGVWVEVTQKKGEGNETYWYDLNKNGEDYDFYSNAKYIKDPAKTWRKYKDASGRDYYVNDSTGTSELYLPPPNPVFEPGYVATLEQELIYLLFHPPAEKNIFSTKLKYFKNLDVNKKIKFIDFSTYNFKSNGRGQTILYAACRTPHVSLDILRELLNIPYRCNPLEKSEEGFYPLGALMASLHENITNVHYFNQSLVSKYIEAIKMLFNFYASSPSLNSILIKLKKNKNIFGLTAYDDFAQFLLYNYIEDCNQLKEICKLLLENDDSITDLFQVCNEENIYPELIRKLIYCGNSVNMKSTVMGYSEYHAFGIVDHDKSGYPITALIKSYYRIKKTHGEAHHDIKNCKAAIGIVYRATRDVDMTKIDSEYPGTFNTAHQILSVP